MPLSAHAWATLEATSRTFALPIAFLPPGLQEAVASAYLCLRAIDEIEDHPTLPASCKVALLHTVSRVLQTPFCTHDVTAVWTPHAAELPLVTQHLGEWALLAAPPIAPRIWEATAATAERMAQWVVGGWRIDARSDLDAYTYSVAGAVGVLLCDLCAWHDGVQADRHQAVALGRGLQAVNILRNRSDDRARGVDFYPLGWTDADLAMYARDRLVPVHAYLQTLPPCAVHLLCSIPLALALATLDALAAGAPKLSRAAVRDIVAALSPSPESGRPDRSRTSA